MKIYSVQVNNRKKSFEIETAKGVMEFPFSRLEVKLVKNKIVEVFIDKELGNEAITFVLESGKEGSVHIDQVLEYNQDPDYLKDLLLYKLTIQVQKLLKQKHVSKREIIRRLDTSPTQFYRLIDQTNTSKTLDQMIRLLGALDCPVDIVFKDVA